MDNPQDNREELPKKSGGGCLKWAGIGCLVIVVLSIIAAVVVYKNRANLVVLLANKFTDMVVTQLPISDAEKQSIRTNTKKIGDAYLAGEIKLEDFQKLEGVFQDGKIGYILQARGACFAVNAADNIEKSDKDDLTFNSDRLIWGMMEGKVSLEDYASNLESGYVKFFDDQNQATTTVEEKTETSNTTTTRTTTTTLPPIKPEELKQFIEDLKTFLDAQGIPAQKYEIDYATMWDTLFDDMLTAMKADK